MRRRVTILNDLMFCPRLVDFSARAIVEKVGNVVDGDLENLIQSIANLPSEPKSFILNDLDLKLDYVSAGTWIDDESYWRRQFESKWIIDRIERTKGSWKYAFFERWIRESLEQFDGKKESLQGLQRILNGSKNHIRHLEIHCLPSHLGVEVIFQGLDFQPKSLILRYGPGNVGMEYQPSLFGMKLSDSRSLAKVLEKTKALTLLDLSNNRIDDDMIHALCCGLENNTSLTDMNFSKNRISGNGGCSIAKILMKNALLRKCDLSDNNISEDGASAIAEALKTNTMLLHLDIGLNQMNDKGTKRILEAVAGHPNLKELKLNANQAHAETAEALCFLLRNNTILKNIDLSSNSFSGHEESIEAALNQNQNITLHLLSCDLREEFLLCIQQFLAFREEL